MTEPCLRVVNENDLHAIKDFTDREIGQDYYSLVEIQDIIRRSIKNQICCSFVLENRGVIQGVRLSFPPGNWESGKGHSLSENLWPYPKAETGYFQSLFLGSEFQAKGFGQKLSRASARELLLAGAKGIVCHSWKESPSNSSFLYLQKMGFQTIAEYPQYWKDVNYSCTRCLKPPCFCTAVEMYLDFKTVDWEQK